MKHLPTGSVSSRDRAFSLQVQTAGDRSDALSLGEVTEGVTLAAAGQGNAEASFALAPSGKGGEFCGQRVVKGSECPNHRESQKSW
jgi:hypothetical protein